MRSVQRLAGPGGHAPPRKFLEFSRGYEIAPETIFGPKRCFTDARQQLEFYMQKYIPFLPVAPCTSTGFVSDCLLIAQG